jgi:hypothetical protein
MSPSVGSCSAVTARGKPFAIFAIAFLFACSTALASNFVRVPLSPKGGSIEIPKNWVVLSQNVRTTIDSSVEARGLKGDSDSELPFAANLLDEEGKTIAIVNARFYPMNELTQTDANDASAGDLKLLQETIIRQNNKALEASGERIVADHGIGKRVVNGITAIVHEHERTRRTGPNVRVRGVRIWNSPRSFTVTLSYRESDAVLMRPIIERITNSIVAR